MIREDARRFIANPPLIVGLLGVIALLLIALFGAQLAAADPNAQRMVIFFPDHSFKIAPTPPDQFFPLGTDPLGRDQLSRILYGARLTLTVVLGALLLRAVLAIGIGMISGWRGGLLDRVLVIVTNAVGGIPQLLLALLLAVALHDMAVLGFTLALGLVGWAEGAQFVRTEVRRIRATPYIESARALGERTRGVLVRHVLRGLGPQLFGLLSLEAGSTLLLLAELGFLGVFMSGGAFLVDDLGRPMLPARDRAPEWGQMLAGARSYAFHDQYVALVPGIVVGAAVFVFNLLGEGVRNATDPFSRLSLTPRALGALGRGTLALSLVSLMFFGVSEARATTLSFDDAMRLARDSMTKVEPGAPLVAAVMRLDTAAHGLERPAKYNFYFRSAGPTRYWRIGFPDADQNAMETNHDEEDGLDLSSAAPLGETAVVDWHQALQVAEKGGGQQYRAGTRVWTIRLVLSKDTESSDIYYRAMYTSGTATGTPQIDVYVDAMNGASANARLRDAAARARATQQVGGPVVLVEVSMSWRPPDFNGGYGTGQPFQVGYTFVRADRPDDKTRVTVSWFAGGIQAFTNPDDPRQPRPEAIADPVGLETAFARVEDAGGRALRDEWGREGAGAWVVGADERSQDGSVVVTFNYNVYPTRTATFRYDPQTGVVTRTR